MSRTFPSAPWSDVADERPPRFEERAVLARVRSRMLGRTEPLRLGRHAIVDTLGQGAHGTVYAAHDPRLDRRVALKLVRTSTAIRAARERLRREARALAALRHPNLVEVYEVDVVSDADGQERLFVVLELLRGKSLRAWLGERARTRAEIVSTFVKAGRGLAAAHAAGVVHGDFKPENVIVTDDGGVKVSDFGLACALAGGGAGTDGASPAMASLGVADDPARARSGDATDMLQSVAPELHGGAPATPASDRFAFCAALYEAFAGRAPFQAASASAVMALQREGIVHPPSREHPVPWRLRRILLRGLDPRPDRRFTTTDALLDALERAQGYRTPLVVGGGALVLAVAAGSMVATTPAPEGCTDDAAPAAAFDEARRGDARRGLAKVSPSGAEAVWARVEPLLQSHVDRWKTERTKACEAHASGELSDRGLDLAMRCHARRVRVLQTWLEVLAAGGRDAFSRAVVTARELDRHASCDAIEGLDATARSPEAEAIDADLRALELTVGSGRSRQGAADAQVVLARARAVGDDALVAEALRVAAAFERDLQRWEDAHTLLREALHRARMAQRFDVAGEIAPAWLDTQARLGRYAESQLDELEDVLARAGVPRHVAATMVVVGGIRMDHDDDAGAERAYARAREVLEAAGDTEGLAYAEATLGLATVRSKQGRFDEAVALSSEAIALLERSGGPFSPGLALAHAHLGDAYAKRDELERAAEAYARSLELFETVEGHEHPELASVRAALDAVKQRQGPRDDTRIGLADP